PSHTSHIYTLSLHDALPIFENVDEKHLNKAIWLFPLYMLAINVFVLPIAFGGLLRFPDGSVDADTFVLTLPMAEKHELLALLVLDRKSTRLNSSHEWISYAV